MRKFLQIRHASMMYPPSRLHQEALAETGAPLSPDATERTAPAVCCVEDCRNRHQTGRCQLSGGAYIIQCIYPLKRCEMMCDIYIYIHYDHIFIIILSIYIYIY